MDKIILKNNGYIKNIYHLADIHIRLLRRHKEYDKVFSNLYKEIKKDCKDSLICIAGDLVHAKLEISPELIRLLSDFLINLSKLAPTIIIAGNHDVNENNPSRLDVLSPIIKIINSSNLHYLKDSGIYTYCNIDFYVFSIFDKNLSELLDFNFELNKSQTSIALYHGALDGSKLDNGFNLKTNIKINSFYQFDITMLGDIHKYQKMGKKDSNIYYASSLIQQDYGESYNKHGLIKWNIKTKKSTFIPIQNDYGYHTIKVEKGKIQELKEVLSINPRIRVEVKDTKLSKLKEIEAQIKKQYKVKDIVFNTINIYNDTNQNSELSDLSNVQNISFQNKLIVDFLKTYDKDIDEEVLDEIQDINNSLNNLVNQSQMTYNKNKVKIKGLWFSNLFSYGKDNYINFDNLKGLIGLFANNSAGKSSLLQIILFILHDRTTKATRATDILNIKEDFFYGKIKIEINEKNYYIEKIGEKSINNRGKANVKVNIDFYYYKDNVEIDENKVLLNGEQRRDTKRIIMSYVGDIENTKMTNFSLQFDNNGLIAKGNAERKHLLSNFLGIDIFEKLYELANNECKEEQTTLKNFRKKSTNEQLLNFKDKLHKLEINKKETEKQIIILEEKINEVEIKLVDYNKQLKPLKDTYDIYLLQQEKTNIENLINKNKTEILKQEHELTKITNGVIEINDKLKNYNENEISQKTILLEEKIKEKNNVVLKINRLKDKIKFSNSKLIKLKDLQYDKDCNFCMNNIFVKDAIQTKDTIKHDEDNLKIVEKELYLYKETINELTTYKNKETEYLKLKKDKNEYKFDYQKVTSKIDNLKNKQIINNNTIEKIKHDIINYYDNEENILFNKELKNKIINSQKTQKEYKSKLKTINKIFIDIHSDTGYIINKIDELKLKIDEIKKHEQTFKAYEYYMKAVNKNGIPYNLIKQTIPIFELEVNNILNQIAEFNLKFLVDDKDIDIYISYPDNINGWNISLAGGMEQFISSIAIRVALDKISVRSSLNCLIVDEGFDVMDASKKLGLDNLFVFIKNYYDFILIISHLKIMRDVMSDFITIDKKNGYSYINKQ